MNCWLLIQHFTVFGSKFIALAEGSAIELELQLVSYLKIDVCFWSSVQSI